MSRSIKITDRASSLLDGYRKAQGGISYSRAIGRLLGYELRTRGQATLEAWKAYKEGADDETAPSSQTPVPYTETDGNWDE